MSKSQPVKAKKYLGQHFLTDHNIAQKIVKSLTLRKHYHKVLEIGPGTGILTQYLLNHNEFQTYVIEIDIESVDYLKKTFPELIPNLIHADFLTLKPEEYFQEPFAIIGNFPYNISSQILFQVLNYRNQIPEVVGMFQKEVAERIASPPKNKTYGILSVLTQAFYHIEYLFTVNETVFNPPPKVKSAVIRLTRNEREKLPCDEKLFFKIVKTAFNQRRKTLKNALKSILPENSPFHSLLTKRAEELNVDEFILLTQFIELRG